MTVKEIRYYEKSTMKLVGTIKHQNGKIIVHKLEIFKNYANLEKIFQSYNYDIEKFNACLKLIADLKIVTD